MVLPVAQDGKALGWMERTKEAVQDGETVCPVNRVTSNHEEVEMQSIHRLSHALLVSADSVQMQIAELDKGNTTTGQRCF